VRQALQKNYKKGTFKMKKANKGFTLAEIITVVALLAVLSVIGVVIFTNLQEQVRQAIVRSDAATLARQANTANSVVGGVITLANVNAPPIVPGAGQQYTIAIQAGPVATTSQVIAPPAGLAGFAVSNAPMNLDLVVASDQPWVDVLRQLVAAPGPTLMIRSSDVWVP
jgi:prepilin-type N-terminal cleavage/methylation domain-containing protein